MGAPSTFTKYLPLLMLLCCLVANVIAANEPGSSDSDPDPNSGDGNGNGDSDGGGSSGNDLSADKPSPAEELLGDLFQGTFASRVGRSHKIDEDEVESILASQLGDIRQRQCSVCIDGLRIATVEGGEMMSEFLEAIEPGELRQIQGMMPVIVSATLTSNFSYLFSPSVNHLLRRQILLRG